MLIYKGENVPMFGSVGDFTLGAYGIYRGQRIIQMHIFGIYTLISCIRKMYFESELVNVKGQSSAISLPGATGKGAEDPLYKDVDIWGYSSRSGINLLI